MSIDERSRHLLYRKLEQILGPEEATTLMQHLPPVGFGDLATRRDLGHLEERMDLRFEALENKVMGEIHRVARSQILALTGIVTVLNGIVFTALSLT